MKKTASEYHQQRRGNCAQSVVHAWNAGNPSREKPIDRYADCGGGRAPGGLCGALHASCDLADSGSHEIIKKAFAERTGGNLTCREVRASRKLSCNDCVALAADLLEKHGSTKPRNQESVMQNPQRRQGIAALQPAMSDSCGGTQSFASAIAGALHEAQV